MGARRKKHTATASRRNWLRIIGGMWRGRKLQFPDGEGLRPTGDRIRETLFNWLQAEIPGARCLDVFAGSGALSFEALSRGAASAVLLEQNSDAVRALQNNGEILAAENIRILQTDAITWLGKPPGDTAFDIVFLDPPFASELLSPAMERLEDNGWLSPNALIYIEVSARGTALSPPAQWQLQKHKVSGDVAYSLYRRN